MQTVEANKLIELRALLAEKFPQTPARTGACAVFPSGIPKADLQRGTVTEVSGSIGCGALFLETLILAAQANGVMAALVDGSSGFDPVQLPAGSRLLWVLCKEAQSAVKAADLLLRDGNLPLVVLDLQMNSGRELRQIPATTWYRFQRILEQSTAAFAILTQRPMVSSAAVRLLLRDRWNLRAMRRPRAELRLNVEPVSRRISASERRIA